MSDDLDTKSGKVFEAESKYLYQKKIEELEQQLELAVEALDRIASWAECALNAAKQQYDELSPIIATQALRIKELEEKLKCRG